MRTVSGPTAEALDKELAMLADRVPILEVLQKREAAKALGDAATNPQASGSTAQSKSSRTNCVYASTADSRPADR